MNAMLIPLLLASLLLFLIIFFRDILVLRKDLVFIVLGEFLASACLYKIDLQGSFISLVIAAGITIAGILTLAEIIRYEAREI